MTPRAKPVWTTRFLGALPLVLAAILIFAGLGSFGLWEPHESERADLAGAMIEGNAKAPAGKTIAPGLHVEERLTALGWKIGGRSELTARVPSALLALIAVAALYFTLIPLVGVRTAAFATLAFASSPVLLFHGRQLTSGMPGLLGETLAFGGLALLLFGGGRRGAIGGGLAAASGLVLGTLANGLLVGCALPAAAAFAALALNGDVGRIFSSAAQPDPRRQPLVFATAALALLATGAFFSVAHLASGDVPLITGGLPATPPKPLSFDFVLQQLAYGWYPWGALVPIMAVGLFTNGDAAADPLRPLRLLALSGIVLGFLTYTVFIGYHGGGLVLLAFPICVGVALAVDGLERRAVPTRMAALAGVVVLAIVVRDLAQQPALMLSGFGALDLQPPKDFAPILPAAIAAAPLGLLLLLLGFFGAHEPETSRWHGLRATVGVPLAALVFGGFITFWLVPGLAVDLSSKHVIEAYEEYRTGDEPLGVYGPSRPPVESTHLETPDDLIEWLARPERVFAMFPPARLASLNRQYRERTGAHLYVVDATSNRLNLATNRPRADEPNRNPIARFVSSEPFDPPPPKRLEVNFDDKLSLLGWELRSASGGRLLEQGQEFTLTTFWRCDAALDRDYKIFVHMDGPGPRMNFDHDPVKGIYKTQEWRPGDYVRDTYRDKVPVYQQAGDYVIRVGMYKGARLPIVGDSKARDNAVRLGKVELK